MAMGTRTAITNRAARFLAKLFNWAIKTIGTVIKGLTEASFFLEQQVIADFF
ncbi:hypothetical protein FACS1894111_13180 [Clostridia bacterium]|nr:hypothetical protein FACS1894111_13180 [Clostridia bacterium]